MAEPVKVLAFCGSARPGSYNRDLVAIAASGAARAGGRVTPLDLADLGLPIYDHHGEQTDGFPEGALRLKREMNAHDALLFASPEYNASVAAPMKNAIDWASRPLPGESWKQCFAGKTAAIMSASTGPLGGLRGLVHLRYILSALHVFVIPQQVALAKADQAFGPDRSLTDADQQRTEALGAELVRVARKLGG